MPTAPFSPGAWCDAIVFDMDGTIADTETLLFDAWSSVWAEHGATLDRSDWAANVGTRRLDDPVAMLATAIGRSWTAAEAEAIHADQQSRYAHAIDTMVARDGVVGWIRDAQAGGYPLAVSSSSARAKVLHKLEAVGLSDAFPVVVGFDEVGDRPKPDPASYIEACRRLGALSTRCLAVEDSPNGVAAAVSAGLRTVVCPGPMTIDADVSRAQLRIASFLDMTLATTITALA